jgi:hypothetical protein
MFKMLSKKGIHKEICRYINNSVFQHPVAPSLVKLILYTVRHDEIFVIFPSLNPLHVSTKLSHLQVFGPKSFTLHFLVKR